MAGVSSTSSSITTLGAPATPTTYVYAGSKAALEQFTAIVAQELGPHNITVNAILPGPVRTETFLEATTPEGREQYANMSPLRCI